jgi:hypothetical protein
MISKKGLTIREYRKTWKRLAKKADQACSKAVRTREGKCFCCGGKNILQCGHLITKSRTIIRYHVLNMHAQCRTCNMLHELYPERYILKFIQKYGVLSFYELVILSYKKAVYGLDDLQKVINDAPLLASKKCLPLVK